MSYAIFMTLAFVSAYWVNRVSPQPTNLTASQRWFLGLSAFCGAMLSAKLPFAILDSDVIKHAGTIAISGKSVLFGLVGGYVGVELAKLYLGITTKTGDSFAVPVAVGIGIGRIGCFFSGCCYGTPTDLPWAVVFRTVDSISRHPIQVYECIFHLTAAGILFWLREQKKFPGQLIKLYFLAYFVFRFATEFIRPEIRLVGSLTIYQWAIVGFVPIFLALWYRDAKAVRRMTETKANVHL